MIPNLPESTEPEHLAPFIAAIKPDITAALFGGHPDWAIVDKELGRGPVTQDGETPVDRFVAHSRQWIDTGDRPLVRIVVTGEAQRGRSSVRIRSLTFDDLPPIPFENDPRVADALIVKQTR